MNDRIKSTQFKHKGLAALIAAITFIVGAVLGSCSARAQDTSVERATKWIAFAQNVDAAKQVTFVAYPGIAPKLKVDGEKKEYGFGVAMLYPLAKIEALAETPIINHTFTGVRLDYMADKLWSPSVNVGFKADVQLFGKNISPFIIGGVLAPFGDAGGKEGDIGAIIGSGLKADLFAFGKADANGNKPGNLGLFYAAEVWTVFPDVVIHRPGAAVTWKF